MNVEEKKQLFREFRDLMVAQKREDVLLAAEEFKNKVRDHGEGSLSMAAWARLRAEVLIYKEYVEILDILDPLEPENY